MPRSSRVRTFVIACLMAALAPGAEAARAQVPASIEPEAGRLLQAALQRIANAKSFTFSAEVTNDTPLPSGEKIQFTGTLSVAVRRPGGYWSRFDGEQRKNEVWFDGKTFTLLNTVAKAYSTNAAPGDLDELFATMREKYGFTPPLSLLMHEDVAEAAFTTIRSGFLVGPSTIDGASCHHLAFRGENVDWQIWLAAEGEPLIRRIVITYRELAGAPQYTATFRAWDFAPQLDDGVFTFTPPPGAVACEFQTLAQPAPPQGGKKGE